MRSTNRIIINTVAQYIRTILNVVLSLWSSRIVLSALGESDFGIYALVAGVVSMLSFLTNALMSSTQRFVSYHHGKSDTKAVEYVFNNSLVLHLIIGLFLVVLLEAIGPILFNGFLNIQFERILAAKIVYQQVLFMMLLSLLSAPFKALLVSHENIVYVSVVEVFDGILKLVMAVALLYMRYDRLVLYGYIMSVISLFNFACFSLFCFIKYDECKFPRISLFNFRYIKEIFGFTGWIVYHSMCIVGRNQGLAIVINKFYNTAVNAALGIGMQVSGAISFVGSSLGNAINPQLIKSEGASNRDKVWSLAIAQCKYSFLLLAAVSIPAMFEMNKLLELWLSDIPQYSAFFSRMVLFAALINQLTEGVGSAKQAIGNMGIYTVIASTPKLMVVPMSIVFLHYEAPIYSVALCFVGAEMFSAFVRLPMLHRFNDFNMNRYYNQVIKRVAIPVVVCLISCFVIVTFVRVNYRWIITFIVSMVLFMLSTYFFSMERNEKQKVKGIILTIISMIVKMLGSIKQKILNTLSRDRYYRRDRHFIVDLSLPKLNKSELNKIRATWPAFKFKSKDLVWLRIYKKEKSFSPYFLCDYQYSRLLKRINPIEQLGALQNKAMCDVYFPQISWPEVYIRSINGVLYGGDMKIILNNEQLGKILLSFDKAIIKPTIMSGCGTGVMSIGKMTTDTFADIIRPYNGNFVIQKVVDQHDIIKKLNHTSLNTCRITSIFIKGKFKATAILKVGKENSILDNWHSSILVGIKENGVLNDYGYDINLIRHERSDSGINFSGINVPYFNDMMAFVERNHKKLFPNAGIIGWDIVADNDGKITVIEINLDFPGILGEQLATCPFFEGFSKDINMLMSE